MYIKKNNVMRKLYTILTMGLCFLCATLLLTSCNNKKNTTKFVENPDMEYRTLGSTGLRVGVIGLGCGGFEEIDSATSRELVTAALDRGILRDVQGESSLSSMTPTPRCAATSATVSVTAATR